MNRLRRFLCLLLIAVVGMVPTFVARGQQAMEYVPNQLIIKANGWVPPAEIAGIRTGLNATVIARFGSIGAELWDVRGTTVPDAIAAYQGDARIQYIEPNYVVRADDTFPNDPEFVRLWGLHNTGQTNGTVDADIDAPEAWDIGTGASVLIGIIDTGVDWAHEDLADNIYTNPNEIPANGLDDDGNGFIDDIHGWDFVNNDNNPFDDAGHGTHVAGTIAGVGNNSIGVVGVSWHAQILPIKFLGAGGSGTTADAILAVQYATLMGARLTNNSWGGGGFSTALRDAIAAAGEAGYLFVAAAGNSGVDIDAFPHYPSSYDLDNIISVASTTDHDDLSSFSNYGLNSVDLGAPGSDIFSTLPSNNYGFNSGTSMATPHVSGALGLLLGAAPTMGALEARDRVLNAVDLIPALANRSVTGGRLNVFTLMSQLDSIPPAPVLDLQVASTGSNTATLTWTATGDDGPDGTASAVDLRYATSQIYWSNFDSATPVPGVPDPQPAGSAESFMVTGLGFNTKYYFAMRVGDERMNVSFLSNLPSATTLGIPAIQVAPSSASDNLFTGGQAAHTITIENIADGTLDFEFQSLPPWLTVDPPSGRVYDGESLDVTLTFDATGLPGGAYSHDVEIASNDPDNPVVLVNANLGVTDAPDVGLSGDMLDYGERFIGFDYPMSLTVTNIGTIDLNVTSVGIDNTEYFADASAFVLAPAESRELIVTFHPVSVGPIAATLSVHSDDPYRPQADVVLQGIGVVPPDIAVSPGALSENLLVGQTATHMLSIDNTGGSDLVFSIEKASGGIGASSVSVNAVEHLRHETPKESTPEGVAYSAGRDPMREPLAPKQKRALRADAAANGGLRILLLHTGTVTEIQNALLAFDDVDVVDAYSGTPTLEQLLSYHVVMVMLNTTLSDPVTTGNVLADYVDAGGGVIMTIASFIDPWDIRGRFVSDGYSPFNLGSGPIGSSELGVFDPAHPIMAGVTSVAADLLGATSLTPGAVWVADWANGQPFVATKGEHVAAVNIFTVDSGYWTGDAALVLRNAALWSATLEGCWLSAGPDAGVIPANSSAVVTVTFDATNTTCVVGGDYADTILVNSNDPDEPVVSIPVGLHVTDAPQITLSDGVLNFGGVFVGATKPLVLTVVNSGSEVLSIADVVSDNSDYTVDLTQFNLNPGETQALQVSFAPSVLGGVAGMLSISSNDPDEPTVTVALGGEGLDPPVITTAPDTLSEDLFTGETITHVLTIGNTGGNPLEFEISVDAMDGAAAIGVSTRVSSTNDTPVATSAGKERPQGNREASGANPERSERPQAVAPLVIHDDPVPGDVIRTIPSPGNVLGLTYLNGSLWAVVATNPQTLVELDPEDGSTRSSFSLGSGNHLGLATDGTTFWVCGFLEGVIKQFTTDGVLLQSWPAPQGAAVRGIAWDGDALWIGGASEGTLYRTDTAGNILETRSLPTSVVGWVMDMEWVPGHRDGALWIVDDDFSDLNEFDSSPDPVQLVSEFPHPDPFGIPEGVAHDGENMWVSGFYSPYIYLVDDGVEELRWLTAEPVDGIVPPGTVLDITITFDAAGLVGGGYDATVFIASNDPVSPVVSVPAHLGVTGAPDISVSEAAIDFGPVFIGATPTQNVVVRNVGTDVLNVANIGVNHADFAVDITTFALDPGQSQAVTVTFAPQTAQSIMATLMIASDDPDEGVVLVSLEGEGLVPPAIGVAPGALADSLFTGGTSGQTLTISNTGGSDLDFTIAVESSLLTAAVASPQEASDARNVFLAPEPIYDPRFAGTQTQWNDERSNAAEELPAPPPLQHMTAMALPVVIDDPIGDGGTVDVTVVRGAGANQQLEVEISFSTPITVTNLGGYLSLDTDQDPQTGLPPNFGDPGQDIGMEYELTFFDVGIGVLYVYDRINGLLVGVVSVHATSNSLSFSVPLSMLGDDDGSMDITGVLGTSAGPTDWFPDVGHGTINQFGWISLNADEGTVPAGESLDLTAMFDAYGVPTAMLDANIRVFSNDPLMPVVNVPAHLDVTGAPDIAARDTLPDYGPVFIGAAPTQTLVVENEGTEILHIASMVSDNSDFTIAATSLAIGPNTGQAVVVTFAPTSAGPIAGTITIVSDDPYEGVVTVALHGEGVEPPIIGVTPSEFADSLFVGGSSLHSMTIANTGTSDLEWMIRAIASAGAVEEYTLTVPSGETTTGLGGETHESIDVAAPPPDPIRTTAITATLRDLTDVQIMWDRSHNQFSSITSWSTIVSDLEARGATVTENFAPVTSELLATVDIIWLTDMSAWTSGEIATLTDWVELGGGILFETDESQNECNAILAVLGSSFQYSFVSALVGVTDQIYDHETTADVASVYLSNPLASFANIAPPAGRLVDDALGTASAVFSELAGGRVVAIADEIFANYAIGSADNQLFGNQVIDWLATGVHWIQVSPASGAVDPQNFVRTDVAFDATGLLGGAYDANLILSSNDPLTPEVIIPAHLDVTGAADIALSDSSFDFGDTFVGASRVRTLTISNEGSDVLSVADIASSDPDFSVSMTSFDVDPRDRVDILVTFSPLSIAPISGTLTIASNDPYEPEKAVLVEGVGLDPPVIGVDPLSFTDSLFTGESSVQQMTVSNTGGNDLVFSIDVELGAIGGAGAASAVRARHDQNRIPAGDADAASVEEPRYGVTADDAAQVAAAVAPESVAGAAGDWEDRAPLAAARGQQGLVAHPNGKIYAFGGYTNGPEFSTLEIYDPVTNMWSPGAPMPTPDRGMASAVDDNGFIYSFAGLSAQSFRYDPDADTWTVIPSPPYLHAWEASAVKGADGRIYLFGGEGPQNVTQIFDPVTNLWTYGAPMPRLRIQHGAALAPGGFIYLIGGRSSASLLSAVDVYDPTTDTWSSAAPMPTPRAQFGITTATDGKIYTIGGKQNYGNNSAPFFGDVEIYDPATDTWETGPSLPIARGELEAVAVGGYIYAIGGTNGTFLALNQRTLSKVWVFAEPSSGVVAPGASSDIEVNFDAKFLAGGLYSATLDVATNDPLTPDVYVSTELHVTGAPDIQLSNLTVDFGMVFLGATPAETLLVSNVGTDLLVVSDIHSDQAEYTVDASAFDLGPGESQPVVVTFSPTTIGAIDAVLTIESNDMDEGVVPVPLTGVGVEAPMLSVAPDSLADSLFVGDETSLQTVTISNSGGSPLEFGITVEAVAGFAASAVALPREDGAAERAATVQGATTEPAVGTAPPGVLVNASGELQNATAAATDVLLIRTTSVTQSVAKALDNLGVTYDEVLTADFSSIDYTPYSTLVVAMSGGNPDLNDMQALWSATASGRTLILIGGTDFSAFSMGMSTYFVNHTSLTYWDVSPSPHLTVTNPSLRLAKDLPPTVAFSNVNASFYMFRADESSLAVAAENGAGHPTLFSKAIGAGQLIYFINSPYTFYWQDPGDYQILETIVRNALDSAGVPWLSIDPTAGVIAPGDATELQVTFSAIGVPPGDYAASLQIATNDPLSPLVKVPVTFAVLGVSDILVPDTLINFGTVIVGAPKIKQFNVWNQGDDDLVVSDISSGNPEITASPAAFTVAPGSSRAVSVTFDPTAPGALSDTVTITSNDPDEGTFIVHVTGVAVPPPAIHVAPSEITESAFTNDVIARVLTIGNPGGGSDLSYSISAVATSVLTSDSTTAAATAPWVHAPQLADTSESAASVPWLTIAPAAGVVPPDDSAAVIVTLKATGLPTGVYSADLTIASNVPSTPTVIVPVELSVTGIPIISVSDTSLDFGEVFIGYPEVLNFAVGNIGAETLTITDILPSDPQLTVSMSSFDVAPNTVQMIDVTLSASMAGPISATLVVSHNAPNQGDIVIDVTADVLDPPVAILSEDSLLVTTVVGETIVDTVMLTNAGGSDLIWSASITTAPGSASLQTPTANGRTQGDAISTAAAKHARIVRSNPHALGTLDILFHGDHGFGGAQFWSVIIGDITSRGATLVESNDPITSQLLSSFEVVWFGNRSAPFLASEVATLAAWVADGGNLLIDADTPASRAVYEDLLVATGSSMAYRTIAGSPGPTPNIYPHETTDGVVYLQLFGAQSTLLVEPPAQRLVDDVSNRVICGYEFIGDGILVLMPDKLTIDFLIDQQDNRRFANQLFNWFGGTNWLSVDPEVGMVAMGASVELHVTMDASFLDAGTYVQYIHILSNDPANSVLTIPVEFEVDSALVISTGSDPGDNAVPSRFALHTNYPNPFNPTTTIRYDLSDAAAVRLEIFNIRGERVVVLVDKHEPAGTHHVTWDGRNDNGQTVATGVYFYRLRAGAFTETKKMQMLK